MGWRVPDLNTANVCCFSVVPSKKLLGLGRENEQNVNKVNSAAGKLKSSVTQ